MMPHSLNVGLARGAAHSERQSAEMRRMRDRIAELEQILGLRVAERFPILLRPMQSKILGLLLARAGITKEGMIAALYGDRPECDHPQHADKVIDVQLHDLRRRLRASGIVIETSARNRGRDETIYRMPPESKRIAKAMMAEAGQ